MPCWLRHAVGVPLLNTPVRAVAENFELFLRLDGRHACTACYPADSQRLLDALASLGQVLW